MDLGFVFICIDGFEYFDRCFGIRRCGAEVVSLNSRSRFFRVVGGFKDKRGFFEFGLEVAWVGVVGGSY